METDSKIGSIRAHVGLLLRRLERTSFRDRLERRLLVDALERALARIPAASVARRRLRPRRGELQLLREAIDAAERVGASLARLRALAVDNGADGWRRSLRELEAQVSSLLATEEDRLDRSAEPMKASA
jgi:hypothetical protein